MHPGRETRLPPSSPARWDLRHRGCELMGLARSTFYDTPPVHLGVDELVARIGAICDDFECYGYRRVGAALRHQGIVVNGKKLRRLMREHSLQPKRRRRYVVTTDSDVAGIMHLMQLAFGMRGEDVTEWAIHSQSNWSDASSIDIS